MYKQEWVQRQQAMLTPRYYQYMRRIISKPLSELKPGDTLIDSHGQPTRLLRKTPITHSSDVYMITFKNTSNGELKTINADGKHIWPISTAWTSNNLPDGSPLKDSSECTTAELAELYSKGLRARLTPVDNGDYLNTWIVYSCYRTDDEDVQCIEVDSPDHTFQLSGGPLMDKMTINGLPTHNCGGPLTLDTNLPLHAGGTVTMGNVKPGDVLTGSKNQPVTVKSISPILKANQLFEIEFEKITDKHENDS